MTIDTPKNKMLSRQQELMNVFDFTLRDLAANREGRITKSQKKKIMQLQGNVWNSIIAMLVIVLITVPAIVCFAFFISGLPLPDIMDVVKDAGSHFLILYGIVCLIILPLIIGFWSPKYRLWKDLQTEIVKTLQGITIVETDPRGLVGSVTIHNTRLQAKRECVLRIKHLEPHVIHYLPNSKVIVSVEIMEQ